MTCAEVEDEICEVQNTTECGWVTRHLPVLDALSSPGFWVATSVVPVPAAGYPSHMYMLPMLLDRWSHSLASMQNTEYRIQNYYPCYYPTKGALL